MLHVEIVFVGQAGESVENGRQVGAAVGHQTKPEVGPGMGGDVEGSAGRRGQLLQRADGPDVGDHAHIVHPVVRAVVPATPDYGETIEIF